MTDALLGALARISRADEHLASLNQAMDEWVDHLTSQTSSEANPDRTEFKIFAGLSTVPDVVRWALLIGDCVHNLRSALDHAVYECSGPTPPFNCEFPIFLDRTALDRPERDKGSYLFKIRGITNENVRSIIEAAQPFSRGDGPEHPLWVLHQLDIQDKHRLLTPVASVPLNAETEGTVSWPDEGEHQVEMSAPIWIPFSDRMEVLTVRTIQPAEKVQVGATFTYSINLLVEDTPRSVQKTLLGLSTYTQGVVEAIRDAVDN